jgi:hypothetical protein
LRSVSYPLRAVSLKPILPQLEDALERYNQEAVDELVPLFEDLIGKVPPRFFCKLISRSPKDFLYDEDNKGKPKPLTSIRELVTSLFASMRCFEDLCMLVRLPDVVGITIRPYIDFNPMDEWRVLVDKGEIRGISQYYYEEPWDNHIELEFVEQVITSFIKNRVVPYMPVDSFIADVILSPMKNWEPPWDSKWDGNVLTHKITLLETNPWGLSDPCLFVSYGNLDGTLKVNRA